MVSNEAPLYLIELHRRVEAASHYKFETLFTSFETSFYPSTIRLGNNLNNSLLQFKRGLRQPPCKPHAFMTRQHRMQDVLKPDFDSTAVVLIKLI